MTRSASGGSKRIAKTAILSAFSLVLLYGTSVVPMGRLGLVALAGLVPAAAIISGGGVWSGLFCYGVTGLLGMLIVPNKGNAVLYLLFFGLYPVVKWWAERRNSRVLEYLCKLAFFDLVLTVFWFGLRGILTPFLPNVLDQNWMVYLAGNLIFMLYDFGFSQVITFYMARIERVLRK